MLLRTFKDISGNFTILYLFQILTPPHIPVCPAVFRLPFSQGSRWSTYWGKKQDRTLSKQLQYCDNCRFRQLAFNINQNYMS